MEKVENGVFVSVHYKGTLPDGKVFDTSEGRNPLEVQMGAGKLTGMSTKSSHILFPSRMFHLK
jgi:FKBP-type peptidyl-prolyl cis-trans isomerase